MSKTGDIYLWLNTAGKQFRDKSQLLLALNLVKEEVKELEEAILNDDLFEIKDAIVDIDWVTRNVSFFAGISAVELEELAEKVKTSNFSKFCNSKEEAELTIKKYKEEGVNCTYNQVGNRYVILRDDMKIMKSINYKPVKEL